MAINVDLRDIQSGFLTATAFTENNTLIEQALQKALNREGGENNEMLADFDMGLNNIINADNIDAKSITVDGVDYRQDVQDLVDEAQGYADDAEASSLQAAQSATDASNSASQAAISAAESQSSFDNFRSIYYGSYTSEPVTDPLGNPPTQGDLYYNSTDNILYLRDGGIWVNFAEAEVQAHELKPNPHPQYLTASELVASDVTYNNSLSSLSATDVQAAIDEVEQRVEDNEIAIGDIGTALDLINGEVI